MIASVVNNLTRELVNMTKSTVGSFEDARTVREKAKPGDLLEYQRNGYKVHKIHVKIRN